MKLELYIQSSCATCKAVEKTLRKILINYPEVQFKLNNIEIRNKHNISIVPALVIDDELYSYGEIDTSKLTYLLENIS